MLLLRKVCSACVSSWPVLTFKCVFALRFPRRYFCGGSFCFMSWCLKNFLCCWRLMCVLVKVTEWPPIGKIAAHSAYDMFHGISA